MLLAESLALWVITKQLRYAVLTAFVFFTVGTIIVAYRLTFLNESVEIFPVMDCSQEFCRYGNACMHVSDIARWVGDTSTGGDMVRK
jgi:hypothetical protein